MTQRAMLDALQQWAAAELAGDADELANARAARDQAIADAYAEPAPMRLELIEQRDQDRPAAGYFTVIDHARGTFADRLCADEALGVFAMALMGQRDVRRLRYMQTYSEWVRMDRRYRRNDDEPYPEPIALLGLRR